MRNGERGRRVFGVRRWGQACEFTGRMSWSGWNVKWLGGGGGGGVVAN